jgi:hypothetical protein
LYSLNFINILSSILCLLNKNNYSISVTDDEKVDISKFGKY